MAQPWVPEVTWLPRRPQTEGSVSLCEGPGGTERPPAGSMACAPTVLPVTSTRSHTHSNRPLRASFPFTSSCAHLPTVPLFGPCTVAAAPAPVAVPQALPTQPVAQRGERTEHWGVGVAGGGGVMATVVPTGLAQRGTRRDVPRGGRAQSFCPHRPGLGSRPPRGCVTAGE